MGSGGGFGKSQADCGLSTPSYFVEGLCPCDERCSFLKDFGKDLEFRTKTVLGYLGELSYPTYFCTIIHTIALWSTGILDALLYDLKELRVSCEPEDQISRVPSNTLREEYLKLDRLISRSGLILGWVEDDDSDDSVEPKKATRSIEYMIDRGIDCYRNLKVEEEALPLLNEMLQLENAKTEKDSAQEKIKILENQIELAKKLPVEKLYPEVEEEINKVSFCLKNKPVLTSARKEISKISWDMIKTRNGFWEQYYKCKGNMNPSELEIALDSLSEKALSFDRTSMAIYFLLNDHNGRK